MSRDRQDACASYNSVMVSRCHKDYRGERIVDPIGVLDFVFDYKVKEELIG